MTRLSMAEHVFIQESLLLINIDFVTAPEWLIYDATILLREYFKDQTIYHLADCIDDFLIHYATRIQG